MKLTINRRYCYKFFIFTVIKYLGSNSKEKKSINSFSIDKLLDRGRENYVNMPLLEEVGFKGRSLGDFLRIERSQKPFLDRGRSTHDPGSIRGSQNPGKAIARSGYELLGRNRKSIF
jgi:hypothetical protein